MKRWIQGEEGFTERGTIRVEVLREIAKRKDSLGGPAGPHHAQAKEEA